jgi:hypothetical protein
MRNAIPDKRSTTQSDVSELNPHPQIQHHNFSSHDHYTLKLQPFLYSSKTAAPPLF